MEHKLEWISEEEGRIAFYEKGEPVLTAEIFITGEEATEFRYKMLCLMTKRQKATTYRKKSFRK